MYGLAAGEIVGDFWDRILGGHGNSRLYDDRYGSAECTGFAGTYEASYVGGLVFFGSIDAGANSATALCSLVDLHRPIDLCPNRPGWW